MDNKELLEKAARAAGYEIHRIIEECREYQAPLQIIIRHHDKGLALWDPMKSDADAFRLMVDMAMEVDLGYKGLAIRTTSGIKVLEIYSAHNNDKHAAARMAIVKAAAQSA